MASRKKKIEEPIIEEKKIITEPTEPMVEAAEETAPVSAVEETPKTKAKIKAKYSIGSIVYVSKNADTDLNGFKLFPQYKKYTYTVEAYDEKSGVYTLRKLNLSLNLKEADIISPDEHAHDTLNRVQF